MPTIDQVIKTKFTNKKVGILGLGIENFFLIKFLLAKKIKCQITISDLRGAEALGKKYQYLAKKKNISWELGDKAKGSLDGFDVIYRSPGWPVSDPAIKAAVKLGVKLSSPINLFFRLCPSKKIIGVTGTKGKGTTASLIYEILKKAGKRVWLGGNIGIAPFSFLEKIRRNDWVVLELSSFQLEDIRFSPHIAVITNIFSDHLAPADPDNPNFHKNLRVYWRAKLNIIKFQGKRDWAIINKKLKGKNLNFGLGRKIFFGKSEIKSNLVGEHNKENIAAALLAAVCAGVSSRAAERAVGEFKGLEHRLEFVREVRGVKYYNDSFATTPESSITALRAFNQKVILIAGGAEKNSNFNKLAQTIKRKVKFLVLLSGAATPRLKKEAEKAGYPLSKIYQAKNLEMGVKEIVKQARVGDIVLLSPACASFGLFSNYKERGKLFKKLVKKIKNNKK